MNREDYDLLVIATQAQVGLAYQLGRSFQADQYLKLGSDLFDPKEREPGNESTPEQKADAQQFCADVMAPLLQAARRGFTPAGVANAQPTQPAAPAAPSDSTPTNPAAPPSPAEEFKNDLEAASLIAAKVKEHSLEAEALYVAALTANVEGKPDIFVSSMERSLARCNDALKLDPKAAHPNFLAGQILYLELASDTPSVTPDQIAQYFGIAITKDPISYSAPIAESLGKLKKFDIPIGSTLEEILEGAIQATTRTKELAEQQEKQQRQLALAKLGVTEESLLAIQPVPAPTTPEPEKVPEPAVPMTAQPEPTAEVATTLPEAEVAPTEPVAEIPAPPEVVVAPQPEPEKVAPLAKIEPPPLSLTPSKSRKTPPPLED